jgi:hypothetical protein
LEFLFMSESRKMDLRLMSVRRNAALLVGVAALGVGASACHTVGDAFGQNKNAPDEFRVVTKAPLVVPPEYALRPPAPGEPRPMELQPESAAEQALIGEREAADRDDAEKLLVAKAGAEHADPLIRYVIDDQFGSIAHKDKSFADRVMFWRKGDPEVVKAVNPDTPSPVDPAKVKALTGGKPVIIARAPEKQHFKLPGL